MENHGKDIKKHLRITQTTTKLTSENKFYYGTQLKRTTIFIHPYKKT